MCILMLWHTRVEIKVLFIVFSFFKDEIYFIQIPCTNANMKEIRILSQL